MSQKLDQLASTDEVSVAISALTTSDLLRLRRIAQLRSSGLTSCDWRDLLNEAVSRALGGARRWPRNVAFMAYMAQTIRSIANEHWRQAYDSPITVESDLDMQHADGSAIGIDQLAANAVHPEREVLAREALAEIEALFEGDTEVMEILEGLGRGLTPKEIQEKARLTSTQYASAQRRIRRKLMRSH